MKNQVLSKEQCKELLDLGVDMSDAKMFIDPVYGLVSNQRFLPCHSDTIAGIPTYTLQDILEKLPKELEIDGDIYGLLIDFQENTIMYYSFKEDYHLIDISNKNLLEMAFNMLKWCLENKNI